VDSEQAAVDLAPAVASVPEVALVLEVASEQVLPEVVDEAVEAWGWYGLLCDIITACH